MNSGTFIGLVNNAAFLLALAVLYDAFPPLKTTRRWSQEILTGVPARSLRNGHHVDAMALFRRSHFLIRVRFFSV
ncbi:hypothetical protein EH221_01020 [bacterium]|nr:MAG: hypothetical protein EH221_01020 [bacterium]